jgi:putative transposase
VHQRATTPRPRVHGRRSRTARSNERWATDITHVACGRDGWAHLTAVIDCHDREIIGYEFALRGRAKEAERALEEACLARFGTLRPPGPTPVIRSDNGLVFQSRRFRAACRDYRLPQEFITPYTPEQNGMIERFFRSLKEECVWQHVFHDFAQARQAVQAWIRWDNDDRPHQALGYRSPREFRAGEVAAA